MTSDFVLYIKGNEIQMNDFVANVISGVLMAIISNLRDIDLETISFFLYSQVAGLTNF